MNSQGDAQDPSSERPPSAARNGLETEVERPLTEDGTNTNAEDEVGRTRLSWAAGKGHKRILQMDTVIDPTSEDSSSQTITSRVADTADEKIVGLLLAKNASDIAATRLSTLRTSDNESPSPRQTSNGKTQGFGNLESQLTSSATEHTMMKLELSWEVPQVMQLYQKGTQFSKILTISGNETHAQAATCQDYIAQHFPNTGKALLAAIQGAWESGGESYPNNDGESNGSWKTLSVRLKQPLGSDNQTAIVTASGTSSSLVELATAFAWFSCTMRPSLSGKICLSSFQSFVYKSKVEPGSLRIMLELLPLREARGGDSRSCWCDLFAKVNIVLDAPISDRSQFRQPVGNRSTIPKGLDVAFDMMVKLAAVDYVFDYENGIVLKGCNTLLVATAEWETRSGTAFQWHFVGDEKSNVSLSQYTEDKKYHIRRGENRAVPLGETVSKATRTFIG